MLRAKRKDSTARYTKYTNLDKAKAAVIKQPMELSSIRMTADDWWALKDLLHARRITKTDWIHEKLQEDIKKYEKENKKKD